MRPPEHPDGGTSNPEACVLAVGAHPDDVELACGGLLLLARERGVRVVLLDLTAGEAASAGDPRTRRAEAERAGEQIGAATRRCAGLPDGGVTDGEAGRAVLVEMIRREQPTLLIGPCAEDPHPDHRAAAALVASSWFLAGVGGHRRDLGPPHRVPRRFEAVVRPGRAADLLLPIDAVWERKLELVRCHASQLERTSPHRADRPSLLEELELVARAHGARAGTAVAEGFRAPDGWVLGAESSLFGSARPR